MPGTRAERISEKLKKFLSRGSVWQKDLKPSMIFQKVLVTTTTKLKIVQKVFVSLLNLYNIFGTSDIEKKKTKSQRVKLNYV